MQLRQNVNKLFRALHYQRLGNFKLQMFGGETRFSQGAFNPIEKVALAKLRS